MRDPYRLCTERHISSVRTNVQLWNMATSRRTPALPPPSPPASPGGCDPLELLFPSEWCREHCVHSAPELPYLHLSLATPSIYTNTEHHKFMIMNEPIINMDVMMLIITVGEILGAVPAISRIRALDTARYCGDTCAILRGYLYDTTICIATYRPGRCRLPSERVASRRMCACAWRLHVFTAALVLAAHLIKVHPNSNLVCWYSAQVTALSSAPLPYEAHARHTEAPAGPSGPQ
ncbi:hypothetical protein B5X24_HaOG207711 [Helicoverpa armigera]|uniref:Uncharacterized protein n=1 Tax=Helicoverpa armigera TaxID=29058 RepID=A0A2W1BHJ5_HELAM|nr:hypothetical protein B5X24_HaOG207711 [Helicoverpa armigera]